MAAAANIELMAAVRKFKPAVLATNEPDKLTISDLSKACYSDVEYSESEKSEINQWLVTSAHVASPNEDAAKSTERLSALNTHLSTRTTLLGSKPSLADLALYARLAPIVSRWSPEERTGEQGYHHIVRHINSIQNAPIFGLEVSNADKVEVNEDDVVATIKPIDPKAEKERKKREKEALAAASAAGASGASVRERESEKGQQDVDLNAKQKAKRGVKSKDESVAAAIGAETAGVIHPSVGIPAPQQQQQPTTKKDKKPKPQKAPEPAAPLSPALIDLRVGHILKAEAHPNADSLYVSTIACGDAPGTENTSEYEGQVVRTVCSGLNGLIPLADMQDRRIIAVCNLKPVTMRGIKSAAMVLAASPRLAEGEVDSHNGPVELVDPPSGSKAGDRVFFEGWEGEPEAVLNPKKKVWDMCQAGFTTTSGKEVAFDARAVKEIEGNGTLGLLRTKAGVCTVPSLTGAVVR